MTTQLDPDDVVRVIHTLYPSCAFKPPPRQFTILAAFVLRNSNTNLIKVISLGTGSKCLPANRLCKQGDALHDSHAEVIARRGATRWLMEEVGRASRPRADDAAASGGDTAWLFRLADGKFALQKDVQLLLYVSTVPCKACYPQYL